MSAHKRVDIWGGLNRLRKQISRAKKQRATLSVELNHLAASEFMKMKSRHSFLFGESLIAFSTKSCIERSRWPRVTNLGMVIRKKIGQSAVLFSKSDKKTGYEKHTETTREWVSNEGLVNQMKLKIQSVLLGNSKGSQTCLFQLSATCYNNNVFAKFTKKNKIYNANSFHLLS